MDWRGLSVLKESARRRRGSPVAKDIAINSMEVAFDLVLVVCGARHKDATPGRGRAIERGDRDSGVSGVEELCNVGLKSQPSPLDG